MKYYKRLIDNHLMEWKNDTRRKPLLLRGARQVGKSSAVRNLGQKFDYYLEINFELVPAFKSIFESSSNPIQIVENLSIYFNHPIIPGKSLIFLDEIQSCPEAIHSLRFFYENLPEQHIIAAGSLLEFTLHELPTFGVGRIRSMFMYPFSFDEFLVANGNDKLLELKNKSSIQNPLEQVFHEKLIELLKIFILIGGMPQAVSTYVETQKFLEVQKILDELLVSYKTDFVKYKKSVDSNRLSEILNSVVRQAGGKFNYSQAYPSIQHRQVKDALELLIMAGLVIPITHSNSNGIPLGSESNLKYQKMILLDTGLHQRSLGLNLGDYILDPYSIMINKGSIAEQFWGLEYIKYSSPYNTCPLYYWQREQAHSNAEVDYVIQKNLEIIPVEIKSSGSGRMQSLRLFLNEKNKSFGYRFSLENFSELEDVKIFPLFAVSSLLN